MLFTSCRHSILLHLYLYELCTQWCLTMLAVHLGLNSLYLWPLMLVVVVLSAKKISSQSAFERTQNYRIVPYHKRSTRLSYVHQDLDLADEDYEKLEEKNRALVRVVTKLSSRWVATEWSRCLYSQHWAYFCYVEMTFHVVCSLLLSS